MAECLKNFVRDCSDVKWNEEYEQIFYFYY